MQDRPLKTHLLAGKYVQAEAEHPIDRATDARGWTEVSGVYFAPSKATRAVVELHLQWAPGGKVEWSDVSLEPSSPPAGRKVRLAAVHSAPKAGTSPQDNCRRVRAVDRTGRRQEGRPGRAARDAHANRARQELRRRGRADPRSLDRVFRRRWPRSTISISWPGWSSATHI